MVDKLVAKSINSDLNKAKNQYWKNKLSQNI